MNPIITLALVDYIQLLHKEKRDKSLFAYFEPALKSCTAHEVNTAIENLMIRYGDIIEIENTVAKFIKAATWGLRGQVLPEYPAGTVFQLLEGENLAIEALLNRLKENYLKVLPDLKLNSEESKDEFSAELRKAEAVRNHYSKLQYGVFPALESVGVPARCTALMWHLEDTVWPKLKDCLTMLSGDVRDCDQFNRTYGQMFFMLGTLVFRENRILFPVAYQNLTKDVQMKLMLDADSYGRIDGLDWESFRKEVI